MQPMARGFAHLEGLGEFAIPDLGSSDRCRPYGDNAVRCGCTGARQGGSGGAFIGIGIPEYEAKLYENAVKDGGTLLSVRCAGI